MWLCCARVTPGCAQARPRAGAPEADPRVPCQLCYVDKERLLLVGYTDGTVATFHEEARLRTHRYTVASCGSCVAAVCRVSSQQLLQLDYSRGWPVVGGITVTAVCPDRCLMWLVGGAAGGGGAAGDPAGAGAGTLQLVDRRHRATRLTCATAAKQLYTVFVGTAGELLSAMVTFSCHLAAGGNILAFWHPRPPPAGSEEQAELENRCQYLLYSTPATPCYGAGTCCTGTWAR